MDAIRERSEGGSGAGGGFAGRFAVPAWGGLAAVVGNAAEDVAVGMTTASAAAGMGEGSSGTLV